MIPSFNSQEITTYPDGKGNNWEKVDKSKLPYVCDCCRRIVSPETINMDLGYWSAYDMNPRLVEVSGVTYYGCSTECARILFDIHHRYTQLLKG